MGKKDRPQISSVILYALIVVGIIALMATTIYIINKIKDIEGNVDHHKREIELQKKRLDEQGSLIDQKKKEMKELEKNTLKALKKQDDQHKRTVDEKQKIIETKNREILQLKTAVEKQKEELTRRTIEEKPKLVTAVKKAVKPKKVSAAVMPSGGDAGSGRTVMMKATAYTAYCHGCSGVTSTGIDLRANPNSKVIAVDPAVIPLGSKVHVEGYGYAIAGDIGGGIDGCEIDIFMPDKQAAYKFGVRKVNVRILN